MQRLEGVVKQAAEKLVGAGAERHDEFFQSL